MKYDQVAGYLDDNYEENSISHKQGGRLNDGRCDRQGRFVCGGYNDMNEDGKTRDKL
jgi:sugar lactone lactonase YvrE